MGDFLCLGLSHQTAPLAVRERLALSPERQAALLAALRGQVGEAMVVSTCNRVELYAVPGNLEGSLARLKEALAQVAGAEALEHLYELRADAALVHLFRVASSLDSMVVGEPQILGQVKDAFELAQKEGSAKGELSRICMAAFGAAKRVRTETEIGRASVSMASAAVGLAEKIFGGVEGRPVLVVGAGEMGELCARHLLAAKAGKLSLANRTRARAEALALELGGEVEVRELSQVAELLPQVDLVFCSTASPTPVFTAQSVQAGLKARRHRPLFMVDLAVPRDIAPEVGQLDGVYAYDVDDLQKMLAEHSAARAEAALAAQVILTEELSRFVRDRTVREGVPVLAQLRSRGEQVARAEIEKTLGGLGDLSDKQKKSIEAMGLAIVNKLLHTPTAKLREVAQTAEPNRLAFAAAELFGLPSAPEQKAADQEELPQEELPKVRAVAGGKG